MKRQKNNFLHVIVLFLIGGLFLFLLILIISKGSPPANNKNNIQESDKRNTLGSSRLFISENMHFSIIVPPDYEIDERTTSVILVNGNGKIIIGKTGTNFNTVNEYVSDLSTKNNFDLYGINEITINSFPAIKLKSERSMNYFIYGTEWTVYTFSTDSEALYGDLDRIAKSFRYIH